MSRPVRSSERIFCLTLVLLTVSCSTPGEWSRFRGPNGQGISASRDLPTRFDAGAGYLWKTPLPPGHSSPVLTRDCIFLTAHEKDTLYTVGLDRHSGAILWKREVPRRHEQTYHRANGPASPSPATDGKSVFVFFGDFGLIAYDLDGRERWRLAQGPFQLPNGYSSSPILVDGLVIVQVDQDRGSYLLAVDAETGEERWRTKRQEFTHGYSTPTTFRVADGSTQLIVTGSYQTVAYSPENGERIWSARGLSWQIKTSAAIGEDRIFVTGAAPGAEIGKQFDLPPFEDALRQADTDGDGKLSEAELRAKDWRKGGGWALIDLDGDGPLGTRDWSFFRARLAARNATVAIRPGKRIGEITDDAVLWRHERGVPVVSSPLYLEGILYTVKDGGILTALDAKTGKELRRARVTGAMGKYYASPIAGDGKIFLANTDGKIAVIKPGPDWEVLSVSDLAEACYATPAISDGVVYIRTEAHLWAFKRRE